MLYRPDVEVIRASEGEKEGECSEPTKHGQNLYEYAI